MGTALTFQPRFGKYLLLKRIARGGMADIFRALVFGAEGFQKVVAIKRMLSHLSSDHQFVDMFINEARLCSHLNHANIVQLHDFGIIDEMLYHCMEYVQGATVADIVQALESHGRPAPIAETCKIFADALYGLDQAHRQKDRSGEPLDIIHRDISPTNLLVSWDGQVKIVDFGIAKATLLSSHTASGMLKGKFRYMSPEQAAGESLDQRSDIFSLGICMYEMLTLSDVFPEITGQPLLDTVRQARIDPPRSRNPEIPEALEAVMQKALARDPARRHAGAAEMRDQIELFLFEAGLRTSTASLARLMDELFHGRIEAEQKQIAREVREADRARTEPSAAGVSTMIVGQDQLPGGWELYPRDEKPEDTVEVEDEDRTRTDASGPQVDEPWIWEDDEPARDHQREPATPHARTVLDGKPLGTHEEEQDPEAERDTAFGSRPIPSAPDDDDTTETG